MDKRGQLYTLEGIAAGLVILVGLFFALQATTATPGATGSLNPHGEQQDRAAVQSTLNAMDDETLRRAVLYWDESGDGAFHCTPSNVPHYPGFVTSSCASSSSSIPPNAFGDELQLQLGDGYSYNVVVRYHPADSDDPLGRQSMVYQGQPGSAAVRGTASVVVENDDTLYEADGDPDTGTGKIGKAPDSFYAPPMNDDDGTDDDLYNVLHVEVVVWQ